MSGKREQELPSNVDISKKKIHKTDNQMEKEAKLSGSSSTYLNDEIHGNSSVITHRMLNTEIFLENDDTRKNNSYVINESPGSHDLHLENWLKSRSNSLSSMDFDSDMRCPELDICEFLTDKGSQSHLESSFDGDLLSKLSENGKSLKIYSESEDGINIFNIRSESDHEEHSNRTNGKIEDIKKSNKNGKDGLLEDYLMPNMHDWMIDYTSLCNNINGFRTPISTDNGNGKPYIELDYSIPRSEEFSHPPLLEKAIEDQDSGREEGNVTDILSSSVNQCIADECNPKLVDHKEETSIKLQTHIINSNRKNTSSKEHSKFKCPESTVKILKPPPTIKLKVFNKNGAKLQGVNSDSSKNHIAKINKEKLIPTPVNSTIDSGRARNPEHTPMKKFQISIDSAQSMVSLSVPSDNKAEPFLKVKTSNLLEAVNKISEDELSSLGISKHDLVESCEVTSAYLSKQTIVENSNALQDDNQSVQSVKLILPHSKLAQGNHKSMVSASIFSQNGNSSSEASNEDEPVQTSSKKSKKKQQLLPNISTDQDNISLLMPPGTSPTMVSVPSVLDSLSGSSPSKLKIANVLGVVSDLEASVPEETPIKDRDDKLNTALEKLGINLDSLSFQSPTQKGKRWRCPLEECAKVFTKLSYLKLHILNHRGIRPHKCSYENCEWSFFTNSKLKRHLETHLKRKDFACPNESCDKRFTTIYNLNTHALLHKQPKKWVCSYEGCDESFITRNEVEKHMKQHADMYLPYKCTLEGCSKGYFTPGSLASHMRSHQKDKDLVCKWAGCGKKFTKPCRLKTHMRVHTGQRPYVCNFEGCNWRFQCASKLSRHQRKHTNDRKFTCNICKKAFLRSEHLKGHLLTHSGVRNFACNVCGSKFTAKSSLYVHLKKHRNAKQTNQLIHEKPSEDDTEMRQQFVENHPRIVGSDLKQLDYIPLVTDQDVNIDVTHANESSLCQKGIPVTVFDCFSKITSCEPSVSVPDSLMLPFLPVHTSNPSDSQEATLSVSEHLFPQTISVIDGNPHLSVDLAFLDVPLRAQKESVSKPSEQKSKKSSYTSDTSARTDVLGNMILSHRAKRRQRLNLEQKITNTAVSKSNFLLPIGEQQQTFTFQTANVQDVPISTGFYPDSLIGSELLSDSVEFAESTINLRDLE